MTGFVEMVGSVVAALLTIGLMWALFRGAIALMRWLGWI